MPHLHYAKNNYQTIEQSPNWLSEGQPVVRNVYLQVKWSETRRCVPEQLEAALRIHRMGHMVESHLFVVKDFV